MASTPIAGTRSRRPQGIFDDSAMQQTHCTRYCTPDSPSFDPNAGGLNIPGCFINGIDNTQGVVLQGACLESIRLLETPVSQVTVVAGNALADLLDSDASTNPGENGYSTQNQRYLHVHAEDTDNSMTVQLWGYNYAFGEWAVLRTATGASVGGVTEYGDALNITANTPAEHYVVDVSGVDRVAFVGANQDVSCRLLAAVSSF